MEALGPVLAGWNAFLNGMAALFLVNGYRYIYPVETRNIEKHKLMMICAFSTSIIFLISYVTRFYLTGVHRYPGEGWIKTTYFLILGTHTVLATTVPFFASRSLWLGLKRQDEKHRNIAKIAFPIWMYVSVTGVIVYFMLYHHV